MVNWKWKLEFLFFKSGESTADSNELIEKLGDLGDTEESGDVVLHIKIWLL